MLCQVSVAVWFAVAAWPCMQWLVSIQTDKNCSSDSRVNIGLVIRRQNMCGAFCVDVCMGSVRLLNDCAPMRAPSMIH